MFKPLLAFSFMFFLCLAGTHAQRRYRQQVQEVILAEVSFARMAADVNIKNAFLHFLDSNGLVFRNGRPMNGMAVYNEVPPTTRDLLTWHPVVAHVSASGDLGFTSGPYAYYAERNKEAVAKGYYFTIWKKDDSGHYKVLIDGGVPNTPSDPRELSSLNELRNYRSQKPDHDTAGFGEGEMQFASISGQELNEVYQHFLNDSSWVLRAGQQAGSNKVANLQLLQQQGIGSYRFTVLGQGRARSNDLAYAYGQVEVVLPRDKSEKRTGFFIRVWQHTGPNWKIIADVLSFQ